ncbi:F-box protein CPR1 [Beta vulgaris subsp. vulgaris]|uniref:F-box protein CPR1 n=1 Tax=Beta vulgaris subsp. vulgaris TaxID=3555 RepID=UPI00203716DB|nr:F-box protein CPR1 [Beta vulgaris subsp. vulgaris]XP_010686909.2 F-box protein CPR1 [Beta vulgaris subsp. vulgaris]
MATFPTEIIAEILSRLPVKSLLRIKCVCKSWSSLIKTPNFILLQLNQTLISNSDRHLLKSSADASFYSAELDLPHNHLSFTKLNHPLQFDEVELFGCCNGVVCISDYDKIDVFLHNPFTKSHRKLPMKRTPNPRKDVVLFGFGYDRHNDDYKVLRIHQGYSCRKCCYNETSLYSLNNHSWKTIQGLPNSYYLPYADSHGVLVGEGLYFVVSSDELDLQQRKRIARFDVRTECFSLLDCPNHDDKCKTNWDYLEFHMRELGGELSVMVIYLTKLSSHMLLPYVDEDNVRNRVLERADLWVMKECGNKNSWVKLFAISELTSFSTSVTSIKPVVYSKDGRRVLIEIDCLELGWYDWESKKFEKLTPRGLPNTYYDTSYMLGSLVSLEYKVHPETGTGALPRKNKKNNEDLDNFLSVGFKLRL